MPQQVVQLHLSPAEPQGWRVTWIGYGPPKQVTVPGEEVAGILALCAKAAQPQAVLVPQHDLPMARAERVAGQRLARVLAQTPVVEAWQRLLGQHGPAEIVLAVSADTPALRQVPWELLTTSPDEDLLDVRGGLVARLGDGAYPGSERPPRLHLRLALWCPTPEDPVCAAVAQALTRLCTQLNLAPPRVLDPQRPGSTEPDEAVEVLHVIAHGTQAEQFAALELRSDQLCTPSAAAGLLGGALRERELVVLDVCSAGDPGMLPLETLAGQVLAQGAAAVIAPARPALLDASSAFSEGLYTALARGEPLSRAVGRGRAQVRALGVAHPAGRASNLLLTVSSVNTLTRPLVQAAAWRPPGWPRPDAPLAALLSRAWTLAMQNGQGHIGVEHLVQASQPSDGGGLAARLGHLTRGIPASRWAELSPQPWGSSDPQPTPRVARLLEGAPEPCGVDALWKALVNDPHHALHALIEGGLAWAAQHLHPAAQTPLRPPPQPGGPVGAFEVLLGPWDGQRLQPRPGDTLGRGDDEDGPDLPLSPPGAAWAEVHVSRRHLRYVGPGQLDALRPLTHHPGGVLDRGVAREGPFLCGAGDLLRLGRYTWLRALQVPHAQPVAPRH